MKEIKQELSDKVETFQRDVLDRVDEIEQYGHISLINSKKYS